MTPDQNTASQKIFNLPFPRNKYFTGRAGILQALHIGFNSGETVQALNGLGGLGKTQTAIEYAYRYQPEYKVVLWGKAYTREVLAADFAAMAALLKLPEQSAQDQSDAINAVKRWFENNDSWLLILDNADELAMAREFIPTRGTGHVLLTTRAQNTRPIAARQAVEKMDPQEGALFLLHRLEKIKQGESLESAPEGLREQAEALAKAVDGLPLALDQAAAFIEETPSTLDEYLCLYRNECANLLAYRGELADEHRDSVAATFSLAFKRVAESSPAAADLLRLCAFLEADAIPEEIFSDGATDLGEVLSAVALNLVSLIETIKEAGRLSLLQRNPETRTVSLHRLVQVILREAMNSDENRIWAERAVRAVNKAFPDVEYSNWHVCNRLVSHVQSLVRIVAEFGFDFPEAARMFNRAGVYLNGRNQYAEAGPLLGRALSIWEKSSGKDSLDFATGLNDLAWLYVNQRRFSEAEPLYLRALKIRKKALKAGHRLIASSTHNLASLYRYQGRDKEAEPLLKKALSMYEKALGKEHPEIATALTTLAWIYINRHQDKEAELLDSRALEIREKTLKAGDPLIASSLYNLSWLYVRQGRYKEAEPLLNRSLEIRRESLGDGHPAVAESLDKLAQLYYEEGKYAEAETQFKHALAIKERWYGEKNPYVVNSLNYLVRLYRAQGNLVGAESLIKRALAILEQALGADHPTIAVILENYAALLHEMNREDEAAKLEARVKALRG